jgi:hypothetical protein
MSRLAGLAALLGVLVLVVTGCGVGPMSEEGKVSESADTYLRSLAAGDLATACEQLTAEAKLELRSRCEPSLRRVVARVGAGRLETAAARGLEIEVDGTTASVVVRELEARLTFVRGGDTWRIARGSALDAR